MGEIDGAVFAINAFSIDDDCDSITELFVAASPLSIFSVEEDEIDSDTEPSINDGDDNDFLPNEDLCFGLICFFVGLATDFAGEDDFTVVEDFLGTVVVVFAFTVPFIDEEDSTCDEVAVFAFIAPFTDADGNFETEICWVSSEDFRFCLLGDTGI